MLTLRQVVALTACVHSELHLRVQQLAKQRPGRGVARSLVLSGYLSGRVDGDGVRAPGAAGIAVARRRACRAASCWLAPASALLRLALCLLAALAARRAGHDGQTLPTPQAAG